MSIDWQMQNGTAGDLSDKGDSLFNMCLYMMMTGVPSLVKEEDADLFTQRVTEAILVTGEDESQLPRVWAYTQELHELGLSTNISKRTKTQWKTLLHNMIEERAKMRIKNGA